MTDTTTAVDRRPLPRGELERLLTEAIRDGQGEWTTGRVKALYRQISPTHIYRSTIRRHLRQLAKAGFLVRHGAGTAHVCYTLRTTVCRCDKGADPYACEAEPEDCTAEFPELNPFGGGARPVTERSAEVSRACPVCGWHTSVWHVDDGSAEAELHDHVLRLHGGSYAKPSAT